MRSLCPPPPPPAPETAPPPFIATDQLAACAICIVVSTTVLLCMFSKHTYALAGFLYAVGCVLNVGQFVRW